MQPTSTVHGRACPGDINSMLARARSTGVGQHFLPFQKTIFAFGAEKINMSLKLQFKDKVFAHVVSIYRK